MKLSQKVILIIGTFFGVLFVLLSIFVHFLEIRQAQRALLQKCEKLTLEFASISNQMINNRNPGSLYGVLTGEAEKRNELKRLDFIRIMDDSGFVLFSLNEFEQEKLTTYPDDRQIYQNILQSAFADSTLSIRQDDSNKLNFSVLLSNELGHFLLHAGFHKNLHVPVDWGNIGFLLAVLVGLSLSFVLLMRWIITRPLEELTENAHQIAAGSSNDFYFSRDREDEIGRLARALHILLQELRAKQRELAEQEKLAVLGKGTGRLTHNISNLLNPLDFYFSRIKTEWTVNPPAAALTEAFNIIEKHINLIKTDLNRLRRAIPQPPKCEPYPLSVIIDAALSRMIKPASVKVEKDFGSEMMEIMVDPEQMTIALYNLIQNAFQAMEPDGGVLSISVTWFDSEVEIEIKDTGSGISPEQKENIFQFFTTTKRNGMGIGLPSALEIVRNHGGTISVESAPNKGSRFIVRLPRIRN